MVESANVVVDDSTHDESGREKYDDRNWDIFEDSSPCGDIREGESETSHDVEDPISSSGGESQNLNENTEEEPPTENPVDDPELGNHDLQRTTR